MSAHINKKEPLIERVFGFVCRNNLILNGETVVVGVSGGPDSVCLLHLLVQLKERLGIVLHVAHLNHLLRGTESEADAEYVSTLASQMGVDAAIEQRDVKSYQVEHRLSLEEAAREVRYRFFTDVAKSLGANRVALGHTAGDQAETILMRLIRGAGIYGLQGMQPLTEWEPFAGSRLMVIRPLLDISRQEVEEYCQQHGLNPRTDSSNLSSSYFRNRIRHKLIPLLRGYNPRISEALLRTADSLAVDCSFFEQQVSLVWDRVVTDAGGGFILNAQEISSLHPALQRYLLREIARRLLGSLKDIEWKHVEKMRAALNLPVGKKVILPRGLTFYVERGTYRLTKN